jgi:hypothetical protein
MNERIRELAEQAGYTPDMFGVGHWDMPECKKFAELIVAECLNQCYNRGMNDELYAGQLKAAAYIEEYFGVDFNDACKPKQGEPVAWSSPQRTEQEPVCDKDPQGCWNVRCQLGKKCKNTPPQRPWVGLTDDEVNEIYTSVEVEVNEHWNKGGTTKMFPLTLYKAIEAKLRSKNT